MVQSNNTNVKILPTHTPIIAHLPQDAALLSIIGDDLGEYEWVMNNFVNIRINEEFEYDDFYREDMWYNCYYIEDNALTRNFILRISNGDFSKFVIDCIRSGYYVLPYINKRSISAYRTSTDERHSPLVYGFDIDKREIYMADFFQSKYSHATASFDELQSSIEYCETEHEWYPYKLFRIIRKKKGYVYSFDLSSLIKQVEDYVSSRSMNGTFLQHQTNDMEEKKFFSLANAYSGMKFGLEYYDTLCDLVENHRVWLSAMYLIRAQKILMKHRFESLSTRYNLSRHEELHSMSNELLKRTLFNQNLYLKSFFSNPRFKYNDRLKIEIAQTKEIDKDFSDLLLSSLTKLK